MDIEGPPFPLPLSLVLLCLGLSLLASTLCNRQQSLGMYFAPKFLSIAEEVDIESLSKRLKSKRLYEVIMKLRRLKNPLIEAGKDEGEEPSKKKPPRKRASKKRKIEEVESVEEGPPPNEPEESVTPPKKTTKRRKKASDLVEGSAVGKGKSPEKVDAVEVLNSPPDTPSKWKGRFRSRRPASFVELEDS